MNPRSSEGVPTRRKLSLIEAAQAKRACQAGLAEPFEPVRFIEHQLPKLVKGFEFLYDEDDPIFVNAPQVQAVVNFDDNPVLIARESIMDAAYRGVPHARFVLCHEIAHVFLHRRKATQLARHTLGSREQYRTAMPLELEANLFGGILMVPPDGVWPGISVFEVRRAYNCSQQVAEAAIVDAKFWWRASGRKWDAEF